MIGSVLLYITLLADGHWLAGQEATIDVTWNVPAVAADAVFCWQIACGPAELAAGQVRFSPEQQTIRITFEAPEVRVRTEARFVYNLVDSNTKQSLNQGSAALHLYPAELLKEVGSRMKDVRVWVWDSERGALADLLTKAGVGHLQVDHPGVTPFVVPDVLIVEGDQLRDEPFEQPVLVNLAEAGAGVLVLRQTQATSVAGYRLKRRTAPEQLTWRMDHPVARHLELMGSVGGNADCWALELPADEPVLEIAWWPRAGVAGPSGISALVAVKTINKGQIVFCQMPLGPWATDPRSQLFLADMLDYLTLRPEETPPPSRRKGASPPHLKNTRITSFSGD